MGKIGPNDTFNLFFVGSGWSWVGEFIEIIINTAEYFFPTQQNMVNRKHANTVLLVSLNHDKSGLRQSLFWSLLIAVPTFVVWVVQIETAVWPQNGVSTSILVCSVSQLCYIGGALEPSC